MDTCVVMVQELTEFSLWKILKCFKNARISRNALKRVGWGAFQRSLICLSAEPRNGEFRLSSQSPCVALRRGPLHTAGLVCRALRVPERPRVRRR